MYLNEAEAGQAIRESGLSRTDIFVTTKYSGLGGLDIETSIQDSLRKVSLGFCTVRCFFSDEEGAFFDPVRRKTRTARRLDKSAWSSSVRF